MAAVVTTTTINRKTVWGTSRVHFVTLAFDTGDYAAGGVAVTPAQFGLTNIEAVLFVGAALEVAATPTGMIGRYIASTGKIAFFQAAAADAPFAEKGAEAFGAGATVDLIVIGY